MFASKSCSINKTLTLQNNCTMRPTTFFESLTIYKYKHFFKFVLFGCFFANTLFRIENPSYKKKMSARIAYNIKFRRMPYKLLTFVSFYRTIKMCYLFSFTLCLLVKIVFFNQCGFLSRPPNCLIFFYQKKPTFRFCCWCPNTS